MRKSDSIKQKLAALKNEAVQLLNKEGVTVEEINAKQREIETQEAALNLALKAEEEEIENRNGKQKGNGDLDGINSQAYERAFYNALRGKATLEEKMLIQNALSTLTEEDGGMLLPIDQQTEIIELMRDYTPLRQYVTIEPVTTKSGTRVIEKDADTTPFQKITENEEISDMSSPQFVNIKYEIQDKGGLLPIPNNLLKDTNNNIRRYLNKWIAKKKVATENADILAILNAAPKTGLAGLDDIKKVLNVTLDPAIAKKSMILTNQDGFNVLDKIKDEKGNYVLQPNPTKETDYLFKGKPVVVVSNKILKTDSEKAPVIIGDLENAITLFDREQMALQSTDIGAGAFEKNQTILRAILRNDVKQMDASAFVYGQILTTDPVEVLKK